MKRVILFAVPVLLAAFSVMSRTSPHDVAAPLAQQEEEVIVEQPGPDDVTDDELEMYIDVYSAMQLDHSLTLDDVLRSRNLTLDEFRGVERRVQNKSRLVAKVRDALLEQATQRSAFSEPRRAANAEAPAKKR